MKKQVSKLLVVAALALTVTTVFGPSAQTKAETLADADRTQGFYSLNNTHGGGSGLGEY